MITTRDEARGTARQGRGRPPVESVIGEGVLRRLGRPANLHRVQVNPVFAGTYRVNVYVRADSASYRVAHSYFLEADGDGTVLASSPPITRLYEAG